MITSLFLILLLGTPSLQTLIDAQKWDEAEKQLSTVPAPARSRFEGLIFRGRGQIDKAADAFERAIAATPNVPQLHIHAAHAYFMLKRFEDMLRHVQAAKALKDKTIAQPLLEARALAALNRPGEAYAVLIAACENFKDAFRPWLELASLAHRQSLTYEVRRAARQVLVRTPDRDAQIALFHLLYGDSEALPLLEQIVAQSPSDAEFRGLLGHVYAGSRRWLSAARLFEEATTLGGSYAFEAADQFRMAGRYRNALRMNGLVIKTKRQTEQRVAILFEQEQYARIVAMNAVFDAPGSRYRVAYAHYAVGDYQGATQRSRALLSTNYRDEAAALLAAMGRRRAP